MERNEIIKLLEELLKEDGYDNPLFSGNNNKGEKYKYVLKYVIDFIKGEPK